MTDLIDRQAAIDALLGITAMRNTIPLDSAIFNIKKLPSAQPVAKDINAPVKDCISRQDTIDAILAVTGNSSVRDLYEHVQEHELSDMWSGGVNAAIDIIIAVPSAQPEIIRCKDCKYGDTFHEFDDPEMPMKCIGHHYGGTYPDDFCSYAERRTNE